MQIAKRRIATVRARRAGLDSDPFDEKEFEMNTYDFMTSRGVEEIMTKEQRTRIKFVGRRRRLD